MLMILSLWKSSKLPIWVRFSLALFPASSRSSLSFLTRCVCLTPRVRQCGRHDLDVRVVEEAHSISEQAHPCWQDGSCCGSSSRYRKRCLPSLLLLAVPLLCRSTVHSCTAVAFLLSLCFVLHSLTSSVSLWRDDDETEDDRQACGETRKKEEQEESKALGR